LFVLFFDHAHGRIAVHLETRRFEDLVGAPELGFILRQGNLDYMPDFLVFEVFDGCGCGVLRIVRMILWIADRDVDHCVPPFRKLDHVCEFTRNPMWQQDAYHMIQRRAADAGIKTRIGNNTFCATGLTAYLKSKGTLEASQHIANHESSRVTKLYDRRAEEISLDEVEKISI